MQRLIRTVLITTALAMTSPASSSAQGVRASATVDATARVVQSLSIRGVRDLDFGDIVAPLTSITRDVGKADPMAGQFEAIGTAGEGVHVSFVAPATLTRVDGPGTLAITLTLYGAPTQAGAGGAERVHPESTITLAGGRYYFFLAGSLTVRDAAANPAGTYTGQFELSVSYTAI